MGDFVEHVDQELLNDASMYFENNKDLMAASDFEAAMKLGCFDQEFTYYGVGYLDENGRVAYRVSSQSARLYQFHKESASKNLYLTPIVRHMKRCPVPSGHEDAIKKKIKIETGRKIRTSYNAEFFQALKKLSDVSPVNQSYELLKELQDSLEGEYNEDKLQLFESLVHVAVESKQLTPVAEQEFVVWLKDIRKQMEDDILPKGVYKKILSGFAYMENEQLKFFFDAKPEVTFKEEAIYQNKGIFHTPVFQKEYWLKDMSAFFKVKKDFEECMKTLLLGTYISALELIKKYPSVIDKKDFREVCVFVKEHCSKEAYQSILSYGYRWNIEI